MNIDYIYDDAGKKVKVVIKQTQEGDKVFTLPLAIDVYEGGKKTRHQVWVNEKSDTFSFSYNQKPDLVNVDGDKILLCQKKDNKTLDNYIYQYKKAGLYLDRREAIDFCAKNQDDPKALDLMKLALNDKFYELRIYSMQKLNLGKSKTKSECEAIILDLAKNDPRAIVRGNAMGLLRQYDKPEYKDIFIAHLYDSSYTIAGNALAGLAKRDPALAYENAKKMIRQPAKGDLMNELVVIMVKNNDESSFNVVNDYFASLPLGQAKFDLIKPLCDYVSHINNTEKVKAAIDEIVEFRNALPEQYGITPVINGFLKQVISSKEKQKETATGSAKDGLQEQIDYIQSKISAEKKGF